VAARTTDLLWGTVHVAARTTDLLPEFRILNK
jgi:hypothetical protein